MFKLIKVLFVFGIFCFAANTQSFSQVEDDFPGNRVMVEMSNDQLPQNSTITNEMKVERNKQATLSSAPNKVAIKPNNNMSPFMAYVRFMLRFYFSNPFMLG